MLKKILAGVSVGVLAASLAYAQNAPQGAAPAGAPAAGVPGAAGRGAGGAGAAGGGGRGGIQKLPTVEQWANMGPKAKEYVAKATALAGNDADLKFDLGIFCKASGGAGNPDRANLGVPEGAPYPAWGAPSPSVRLPAQRIFDNFWWLGDTGVGSFLITSNDGYILMDASNTAEEAKEVIVDAMAKVGLDAKKIKYIVIGHNHFDHTGGGHMIQELSGAKVLMGRDDWEIYLRSIAAPNSRFDDKVPMRRDADSDAKDGQKITVGDVTATIFQMTGHTPGSIGMVTPIKWKGRTHNILLITAGSDVGSREAFVGGYEHIWDEAIKMKAASVMQVHPNTNMNSLARVKYVNDNFAKLTATNNPILYGSERTERYLNIVRNCTLARMDILGW